MKRLTQSILVVMATSSLSLSYAQATKKDSVSEKEIEEVVMVGYAKQSKKTLTNSITSVSDKVLESAPRANVATALQGSVAGVRIVQTTGQPGATPVIQLRGGTHWDGSGTPLILIDGVPGTLSTLNSEDIERIDVMKDAAATAVYGARGANGVVFVTTKQGKRGRANINFYVKNSFNFRREAKQSYMNASEFVKFNRLAVRAFTNQIDGRYENGYLRGANPAATGNNTTNSIYTTMYLTDANRYLLNQPGWQTMVDPIDPSRTLIFMDNNMESLYYQPSTTEDYTVSVDGGNDRGTYYASLGYMNDRGIVYGSGFRRISGTLNASYKIKENLKVAGNITYARTNETPSYLGNDWQIFQRAAGLAPTHRIYYNNPDGTLSNAAHPGTAFHFGNPLYYNDKFQRDNLQQRLTASMQMDWQFAPKFNLMVRGSHFSNNITNQYFAKSYISGGNLVNSRVSSLGIGNTMRNQLTTLVSYKNTFGQKHNLEALVGTEYFKQDDFSASAATRLSGTDLIPTMGAGSEAEGVPSSYRTRYSIGSLISQVNYDYDGRYLLGLTFRADGTSRLAKENRFDYFPGVSLGWAAHRENFYKNLGISKVMNQFKPRASYGVNGNIDNLSNFGVYGIYSNVGIYDGITGYRNTTLPNPVLMWERATSLNFGLDLGFLSNRVNLSADYFIKDIYNKISSLTLPQWTGFSSIGRNIGTLQNRGLELDLKVKVINTENLQWNVGGNFFTMRSYVKKLAPSNLPGNRIGGERIYDPATKQEIYVGGLEEGQRVGQDLIIGFIYDGVYKTQKEVDEANSSGHIVTFAQKQNTRFLGDAKFRDINGDNIIDHKDRVVIGRTTPKFTGGFNTDISYKNFNLYIRTDFAVGHMAYNQQRERGFSQVQGAMNGFKEVTQTWTPENPDSNLPRFVFTDPQGNYVLDRNRSEQTYRSTLLWEKADYLAIREVTLSYNLPGSAVNNMLKNLRLYVTGTNLAYITPFSGVGPEAGGVDSGRYPLPANVTLGISATF